MPRGENMSRVTPFSRTAIRRVLSSLCVWENTIKTRAFLFVLCLLAPMVSSGQATAASGYAVTSFATGFVNSGTNGIGPIGLAFDASGNLFVGDYFTGFLYRFPPQGGSASPATQLNTTPIGGRPAGLAFAKDGRLYLARHSPLHAGDSF